MKGILFKEYLLPSVMAGEKTQTRRMIKPQPDEDGLARFIPTGEWHDTEARVYTPRYQPGEVVYVKETWCYVLRYHAHDLLEGWEDDNQYVLKSMVHSDWMNYAKENYGYKWKSPMFMPEEAARTFLKITDVRAERICDISEEDCIAEGIIHVPTGAWYSPHEPFYPQQTAQDAFFALIRSVDAKVDLNAWVWVYDFELTEKPQQ